MGRRLTGVVVAALACGGLAACGPAPARPAAEGTTPASSAASAPPSPAGPGRVVVGVSMSGRTVRLGVGDTLVVVLGAPDRPGSTGWTFQSLGPGVLAQLGAVSTLASRGGAGCGIPGAGCGTVTLTALARSAGAATLTASRTSCGEALRCSAAQGTFRLTVLVRP